MNYGLIACAALLLALPAQSQQAKGRPADRNHSKPASPVRNSGSLRLEHVGSYPAKRGASDDALPIADPTIRALNMRGYGGDRPLFGNNSILGLPKGTYGYARGQLWLRSTDATSIGGITGNSSVGTGSAAGSVGTGGFAAGVNGKSPYAGPGIWGSAQRMQVPDSVIRRSRALPRER